VRFRALLNGLNALELPETPSGEYCAGAKKDHVIKMNTASNVKGQ
jgi:hypothetical protein